MQPKSLKLTSGPEEAYIKFSLFTLAIFGGIACAGILGLFYARQTGCLSVSLLD